MDLEGIYRKSGGTGQINQIRQGFESQEDYDISDPDIDITAITSVLKQYLRRLPNPLITFDVYDRFLQAGAIQDKDKRWQEIRACLNELPRAHLECIQFLVFHLAQVVSHPTAKVCNSFSVLRILVLTSYVDDSSQSGCRFRPHDDATHIHRARDDRYGEPEECRAGPD
jgi:hypothetical protein